MNRNTDDSKNTDTEGHVLKIRGADEAVDTEGNGRRFPKEDEVDEAGDDTEAHRLKRG